MSSAHRALALLDDLTSGDDKARIATITCGGDTHPLRRPPQSPRTPPRDTGKTAELLHTHNVAEAPQTPAYPCASDVSVAVVQMKLCGGHGHWGQQVESAGDRKRRI